MDQSNQSSMLTDPRKLIGQIESRLNNNGIAANWLGVTVQGPAPSAVRVRGALRISRAVLAAALGSNTSGGV